MIRKRPTPLGKTSWGYIFDAPRNKGDKRQNIAKWGFERKSDAIKAEAESRIQAQQEYEARKRGATKAVPGDLAALLEEFFHEHASRNLAPKTVARYREMAAYLDPELLKMLISKITPLHLTREWNRLKDSGGRHRNTKASRPLSGKTVRNIAGFVSSALSRAVAWQLLTANPAKQSDRPRKARREAAVMGVSEQDLLLAAGEAHWALPILFEIGAATGARRGEVMAMRWSDLNGSEMRIGRSLSQVKQQVFFKEPKTEASWRSVSLPASTVADLDKHRAAQDLFRQQFGTDYRADLDLIVCDHDGSPLKPDSISSKVSLLCKKLKLPKGVSLHSLRHSHGSHLLAAGVPLAAVSKRLGHANVAITASVYAHALKGQDQAAADAWENFQGRGKKEKEVEITGRAN